MTITYTPLESSNPNVTALALAGNQAAINSTAEKTPTPAPANNTPGGNAGSSGGAPAPATPAVPTTPTPGAPATPSSTPGGTENGGTPLLANNPELAGLMGNATAAETYLTDPSAPQGFEEDLFNKYLGEAQPNIAATEDTYNAQIQTTEDAANAGQGALIGQMISGGFTNQAGTYLGKSEQLTGDAVNELIANRGAAVQTILDSVRTAAETNAPTLAANAVAAVKSLSQNMISWEQFQKTFPDEYNTIAAQFGGPDGAAAMYATSAPATSILKQWQSYDASGNQMNNAMIQDSATGSTQVVSYAIPANASIPANSKVTNGPSGTNTLIVTPTDGNGNALYDPSQPNGGIQVINVLGNQTTAPISPLVPDAATGNIVDPNTGFTPNAMWQSALDYAFAGKMPPLGLGSATQTKAARDGIINQAAAIAQLAGQSFPQLQALYKSNSAAATQITERLAKIDTTASSLTAQFPRLADLADQVASAGITLDENDVAAGSAAVLAKTGSQAAADYIELLQTTRGDYAALQASIGGSTRGGVFFNQTAQEAIPMGYTGAQYTSLGQTISTSADNASVATQGEVGNLIGVSGGIGASGTTAGNNPSVDAQIQSAGGKQNSDGTWTMPDGTIISADATQ